MSENNAQHRVFIALLSFLVLMGGVFPDTAIAGRLTFPVRGAFRLFSRIHLPRFHPKEQEIVSVRSSAGKKTPVTQSPRFIGAGSVIANMADCQKDAKQGQSCKAR